MSSSIFIFWKKNIVSHRWDSYKFLCVFFFYLCLSWWLMFIWSPWEKLSEVMFKFLWTIILNFWNRVLKIDNRIFAKKKIVPHKKMLSVLLSASVERFRFSRRRDFVVSLVNQATSPGRKKKWPQTTLA